MKCTMHSTFLCISCTSTTTSSFKLSKHNYEILYEEMEVVFLMTVFHQITFSIACISGLGGLYFNWMYSYLFLMPIYKTFSNRELPASELKQCCKLTRVQLQIENDVTLFRTFLFKYDNWHINNEWYPWWIIKI